MRLILYKNPKSKAPKSGTMSLAKHTVALRDDNCPLNENYGDEALLAATAELLVENQGHSVEEGDVLFLSGIRFVKTGGTFKKLTAVLPEIIRRQGYAHPNVAELARDLYRISDI